MPKDCTPFSPHSDWIVVLHEQVNQSLLDVQARRPFAPPLNSLIQKDQRPLQSCNDKLRRGGYLLPVFQAYSYQFSRSGTGTARDGRRQTDGYARTLNLNDPHADPDYQGAFTYRVRITVSASLTMTELIMHRRPY